MAALLFLGALLWIYIDPREQIPSYPPYTADDLDDLETSLMTGLKALRRSLKAAKVESVQ
jgi:hypothetical protein